MNKLVISNSPYAVFKISDTEEIRLFGEKPGEPGWVMDSSIDKGRGKYAAAVDGMEALILALAYSGVEIGSPEFGKAVLSAMDTIANDYGH